ncbi:hypothetical protein EYZ11_007580 [Aspergillus tanneri]|uniref:Uncharacterized protein n=1 Tax=Aspergillus tanneri TaxID=1220188 RepID=A0A4S3JEV5_9EURO|nr:hypothetical protein EYZ11_007580 [Aspergillus tanneri]
MCSSAVSFAIGDRKHLLDLFSGKAKFLDFSLNNILRLEPFLRQDEQAFYELLKNIEVCETDGISSELHLNQDGNDIKVEISRSELHFQENHARLTIYVPRDEKDRDLCFLDRLPRELLEWIMTEPSTGICEQWSEKALNVLSTVLQAQDKYVALTLDRSGIMSVDTPDDSSNAPISDHISSEHDFALETPRHRGGNNSNWDTLSSTVCESSADLADVEEITTTFSRASRTPSHPVSHYAYTPQPTPRPRASLSPAFQPADDVDSEYRGLLHSVVAAARRFICPGKSPFDMSTLSQSLDPSALDAHDEAFRLRTLEKIERDKKIGAAGELFVSSSI